ncbi:DNA helicase [Vibrio phage SHOU24]|uniref:DNA helicase n=1 Tax=Vibrio phage SHOU24 TaxID=1414739 RepID=UPI0003ED1AB9|nr:DNA helicase [Vibrio phage SHOU24]AHI61229.1 DNA helicase [Vibrio phage SHOU24]
MTFKLNQGQLHAEQRLREFMADPNRQVIIVVGPGGSGKTHSTADFVGKNFDQLKPVCLTAPTNKATGVLGNFAKDVGRFIPTMTIYKLLGIVVGADGEEKTTFSAHDGMLDRFKTVILDEGSMAGYVLCNKIRDKLEENPYVKIIVMMDKCQLPPVNETMTQLLEFGEVIELTEDMRSGNGPLLQVKRAVRDITLARLKGKLTKEISHKFETHVEGEDQSGVHLLTGKDFDDAMLDQFDTEEYRNDPNTVRALAWTNKEVDRMNRIIRSRIYGKGCEAYVVGERICVLTPVRGENDEPILDTDEEVTVKSLEVVDYVDYTDQDATDDVRRTYKAFRAELERANGQVVKVHLLHPDSKRKFERRLSFIADQCHAKKRPWKQFWAFKEELFVNARPAHALTIHKSQGQTFKCVFLNLRDAMNNKNNVERSQLVYVGVSRPTTDLVVNLKTFY